MMYKRDYSRLLYPAKEVMFLRHGEDAEGDLLCVRYGCRKGDSETKGWRINIYCQ